MPDPTVIPLHLDPREQRFTGVTAHGNIPINVPYMTEIAPNLWQGGCNPSLRLPSFIKHLVSLYPWESYRVEHKLDSSLSFRAHDSIDQDLSQVEAIASWAHSMSRTGPVLIHCQAGLNRSGLVMARVLMMHHGMNADEAINHIRETRSPACLCNPAFEAYLRGL